MLHFPLLSDAYVAALCGKHEFLAESESREGAAVTSRSTLPEQPFPSRENEGGNDDMKDDYDMETARTRPLRLDQIHL
jgi:hypothetical protein